MPSWQLPAGVLAMLTLWENRRKNLQEKDKNDIDHTRQVKAERRSRYAKAIEQLADDKSTVRLGGIYTLAKLADEWLSDDKTVPSEDSRTEEAQIGNPSTPYAHTFVYPSLLQENKIYWRN